jgi:hypothetical protein
MSQLQHVQERRPHARSQQFDRVLWFGRLLFAAILGNGLWNAAGTALFLSQSVATSGQVVGHHADVIAVPSFSGRGANPHTTTTNAYFHYVDVSYRDPDGSTRFSVVPESACWGVTTLDIPIRHDRADPPHVRVDTFWGLWATSVFRLAAGAVLAFIVESILGRWSQASVVTPRVSLTDERG